MRTDGSDTIDSLNTKHYFQMQTQTQHNLIMKVNQMSIIYHTPICHWPKNLGYVGFEFMLQLTFGA